MASELTVGKVVAENSASQQIEIGDGAGSSWDFGRNTTSGSLVIRQNTTEKLAVSATGLAVTGAVSATTLSTFSNGIALGNTGTASTGTPSSPAQTLDWYEVGTFTPTLATGTATVTGRYTRVGNKVTIWFVLSAFDTRDSTNLVVIGGLPFTSNAAQGGGTIGSCMTQYCAVPSNQIYMSGSVTEIKVYGNTSGAWVNIRHADLTSSSSVIYGSGTYYV